MEEAEEVLTIRGIQNVRPGKIFVKQVHSNMGKSTFSNRVITNWNNLPAALKFANNNNLFKNLLDNDSKFKVRFRSFDI